MSESLIKRTVIITSFKELMLYVPFSKISIGEICEKAFLNRKSFYYHFKDKYDLVNSCFDNDASYLMSASSKEDLEKLYELCKFLYENRSYYKKLFEIEGQNCFSDHLKLRLFGFFMGLGYEINAFCARFFSDAVFCALKDWILSSKCEHYDSFYPKLKDCIRIDQRVS